MGVRFRRLLIFVLVISLLFNQRLPGYSEENLSQSEIISEATSIPTDPVTTPLNTTVTEDIYNTNDTAQITDITEDISSPEFTGELSSIVDTTPSPIQSTLTTPVPSGSTQVMQVQTNEADHGNDFEFATSISIWEDILANIEKAGDEDYFKFIPSQSGMYAVESTGSTDTAGYLYNYLQTNLSSNTNGGIGSNFYIVASLIEGQTYYIKVAHNYYSGTGEYTLKITALPDDHGNYTTNSTAINYNNDMAGNIDYIGDYDFYRFTTSVSGSYIIETTGTTDTLGYLYDSNGSYIASNNNASTENKNFSMNLSLIANCTYYIRVSHNNSTDKDSKGTGAYALKVLSGTDDHGNNYSSATLVQVDTETSGYIESGGDIDYFRFIPQRDGYYSIETTGTTDTYGYLYNSSQSLLSENNNEGIGSNFYIIRRLTANEVYYVRVGHNYSNSTGYYNLKVIYLEDDHGNDTSNATVLQLNDEVSGEIQYSGDYDYFKFTPTENGAYIIESTGNTDVYSLIYDRNGSYLSYGSNISSTNLNFKINITLSQNNTYFIGIRHNNSSDKDTFGIGAYGIKVYSGVDDHGNDILSATPIQADVEVSGNIESEYDKDYFKFIPQSSGVYTIESSGSNDLYGYLKNSSNTVIKEDNNNGTGYNFYMYHTFIEGETYYIDVKHNYSNGKGEYALKIVSITDDVGNDISLAETILVGSENNRSIDYTGDFDVFKFKADVSGYYVIESTGNTDTIGYLYENNNYIAGNSNGSSTNLNFYISAYILANTNYYIKVYHQNGGDKDNDTTGFYGIKVYKNPILFDDHGNDIASATQIQSENTVWGNIEIGYDTDYFKYTPEVSGVYSIESFGSTNVNGTLFNSSNNTMASNSDGGIGTNFYILTYLKAGETYYIKVQQYSNGTGIYSMLVSLEEDDVGNYSSSAATLQLDSEYSSKIDYAGDVDVYKFTTSADGTYLFESTGALTTKAYLYDMNNSYITNNSPNSGNFLITVSLLKDKTYYLYVSHKYSTDKDNAGLGEYGVKVSKGSDDHGNGISSSTLILVGEQVTGKIDSFNDEDYFEIIPESTGLYAFESMGSTDVYGYLNNINNNTITQDNNSGTGNNFYFIYKLTAGQKYYLRVTSGAQGQYSLKVNYLSDDHGNDYSSGTDISIDSEMNGTIDYIGDGDAFRFTPPSTGVYIIKSIGSTDTKGFVYTSNGSYVYSSYSNGTDINFYMPLKLVGNQSYYILVNHQNSVEKDNKGTGDYTVSISTGSDDYGDDFATATQVQADSEREGSIDFVGDYDYLMFVPSESGSYTLETDGTTDTYGALYDKNKTRLAYANYGGEGYNFKITYNLTGGEIYYLAINHYSSGGVGPYKYRIFKGKDDYSNYISSATNMTVGSEVQGLLNYDGDTDCFRFTPLSNGVYTVMSIGETDTYGETYDNLGNMTGYNDNISDNDLNFSITLSLQANKTCYIKVKNSDFSYGTGEYTLRVLSTEYDFGDDYGNSFDISTRITENTEVAGKIDYPSDVDYFIFTPLQTGLYLIESSGETNMWGCIYNSSHNMLLSDDNSGVDANFYIPLKLEAGENYYLKVYNQNSAATGNYNIKVLSTSDDHGNDFNWSTDLYENIESNGEINYELDVDTFKFTPSLSGLYVIYSKGTTDTQGKLYNSIGGLISSNSDWNVNNQNFNIIASLNGGQVYYLKVWHQNCNDKDNGGTGKYSLIALMDGEAPQVPSELDAIVEDDTVYLSWAACDDNIEVVGYEIYRDGQKIGVTSNINYTDMGLMPNSTYVYKVRAFDISGNYSGYSPHKTVETYIDTVPPTVPESLVMVGRTGSSVELAWDNSEDNTGVSGYEIFRDGVRLDSTETNYYVDKGLIADTVYKYTIRAYDREENKSDFCEELWATPLMPKIIDYMPGAGATIGGAVSKRLFVYFEDRNNLEDLKVDFEYSQDGVNWTTISSNKSGPFYQSQATCYFYCDWNLEPLSNGLYTVRYSVFDKENHVDQQETTYMVDRSAPSIPENLVATSMSGLVKLTWKPSPEADTVGYKIFRSTETEGTYEALAQINDKFSLSYTDKAVDAEATYYYKISAIDKFSQESEKSGAVSVFVNKDTTIPVISRFEPASGTVFSKNATIVVRGEDNILLDSITLMYSLNGEDNWVEIETISTDEIATFNWNLPLMNGNIYVRAIAKDSSGNESLASSRYYRVDQQGPALISGLTGKSTANTVTLSWKEVPEADFAYFQVERKGSEAAEYQIIEKVENTAGINIYGLSPNSSYWFRVKAYDKLGNSGEGSEIQISTSADTKGPVIKSLYPLPGRFSDKITLNGTAIDDVEIGKFTFQVSRDKELWSDLVSFNPAANQTSVTYSHEVDISEEEEGAIYFRVVAQDRAGNMSDTSLGGAFVEHRIDHTPPQKPSNFNISSTMGYLNLFWDKGDDTDIAHYRVYRANIGDGEYASVCDKVTHLNYYDRDIVHGNMYHYKITAVDQAGNESLSTEVLSGKLGDDTEPPIIRSINPSKDSTLPANPVISILVSDNYKLSNVMVEYKEANSDQWKLLESKYLNVHSEAIKLTWNTSGLSSGNYLVRAVAKDHSGNTSQTFLASYCLDLDPPVVPEVSAVPSGWTIDLSWTSGNEADLKGFRVYRSTLSGASYKLLSETESTSFIDSPLAPGKNYYYKIEAVDIYGNVSTSEEIEITPLSDDTLPPVAQAGVELYTTKDMEVSFDGMLSTDNDKIASYTWDFGDGTISNLAKPNHAYSEPGTYYVTHTVKDFAGNISTDTTTVTVYPQENIGTVEVNVVDGVTGQGVYGASVCIDKDVLKLFVTDVNGNANIVSTPGNYNISAYKSGYIPSQVNVEIEKYKKNKITIIINKDELVIGGIYARRMEIEEIIAAGIDITDPKNQHLYEFEVQLTFNQAPLPVEIIRTNGYGEIITIPEPEPEEKPEEEQEDEQEDRTSVKVIPQENHPEVEPTLAFISISKGAAWVKEFFDVGVILYNTAQKQFVIADSVVKLKEQDGISLAPTGMEQSYSIEIGDFAGEEIVEVHWIIRGDKKGYYDVEAEFNGTLMPFGSPLKANFKTDEQIRVWGGDALHIYLFAEEAAFIGEDYYAQFIIANESDIPIYNLKTNFGSYKEPSSVHKAVIINTDGSKTVEEYNEGGAHFSLISSEYQKSLPVIQPGDSLGIDVLYPGDSISGTYCTEFSADGDPDDVYYTLSESFHISSSQNTTEVPVTIESIPSHVTKYKVVFVQEDAMWADPVDTTTGANIIEREALSVMGSTQLSFDMDYNSLLLEEGDMGKGWSHNYETKVVSKSDGSLWVYWSPSNYTKFYSKSDLQGEVYGTKGPDGEIILNQCPTEGEYIAMTQNMKGYLLSKHSDGTYTLLCGSKNSYTFDSDGNLTKLQDKNGHFVTVSRNDSKLVITEPLSEQSLTVNYNSDGLIQSVGDKMGRSTSFEYNTDKCLTTITDPNGKTTVYTYDSQGHVLTGTDGEGITFLKNTYDSKGRVLTQDDGVEGNELTTFTYDENSEENKTIVIIKDRAGKIRRHVHNRFGQLLRVEDELSNTTYYEYDKEGNRTKVTDANGNSIIYTYDSEGNPLTIKDKEGIVTTMTYDENGNMLTTQSVIGEKIINTYDENNFLITTMDESGNKTIYNYSPMGQLVTKTVEGVGSISYAYDNGRIKTIGDFMGNDTTFGYDVAGRLTSSTDREGNASVYEYDGVGNKISETDPSGNKVSYTYDSRGNILSQRDERNNKTLFKYNGNGKLIEVTDPKGNKTTYEYDQEDRLVKTTDPQGFTAENIYDDAGRVIKTKDALGNITTFTYDKVGNILTQSTSDSGTTTYSYYKNGKVKAVTDAAGSTTTYTYDASWRLVKITDGQGKATTYTYDLSGNLLSVKDPLTNQVSYTYDRMGNMLTSKDANGAVTNYTYNANGCITSVTDALNNKTLYKYDKEDRLTQIIDARGYIKSMEYDASGKLTTITDPLGNVAIMEYDAAGNLVKLKDAYGVEVQKVTFDSMNLPVVIEDALGNKVTNSYDSLGRLVETIDALNRSTKYNYDKMHRLVAVTDPLEGESKKSYDGDGNLKSLTDPNGNKATFNYDGAGRLVSETTAIGSVKTYGYNSLSLLESMKNGRGQETTYVYDDAGRLTGFSDTEGTVSYGYDAKGNVLTVKDSTGTITREYDLLDRVTKYTDCNGNEIKYSYDSVGNLIALTYPGGKIVRYEYDAANRLVKVTDWSERITRYEYDKNGRLNKTIRPNGTVMTATYNVAGQVRQYKDADAGGNVINQYDFTYDVAGNVTVEKSSNETGPFHMSNAVMTYDKGNRLITYNGQTVKYDLDGNMIYGPLNGQMVNFTYDSRNMLVEAGGTQYLYNGENTRIALIEKGVRTDYVNNPNGYLSQLLMEKDSQGNETFYVYGIGLIGHEEKDGSYRTYHFDRRGSTTAISDLEGRITDRFDYATYGELVGRTGSTKTPFLYNGRDGVMTDSNGLYYMRARYYNTDIKRFINQDILEGRIDDGRTLNRYAYVNGNPVSLTDPFGLSPEMNANSGTGFFDGHMLLDMLGLIPGLGEFFDAANLIWYLAEDDYQNAAWSATAIIPIVGSGVAIGAKWGSKPFKATKFGSKMVGYGVKIVDYGKSVGKSIALNGSMLREAWRSSKIAQKYVYASAYGSGEAQQFYERLVRALDKYKDSKKAKAGLGDGIKGASKANPEKVVNALSGFKSKKWTFGNENFMLDKSGMKHILERHHPEYWDGSIKSTQTFLDSNLSIDDIANIADDVLKQNRSKLIQKGTTGMYQVEGTVNGVDYVVGLNKGRVGQLYKK